jgi:hypothetical protein
MIDPDSAIDIRARHVPKERTIGGKTNHVWCAFCLCEWPCDVVRLADLYETEAKRLNMELRSCHLINEECRKELSRLTDENEAYEARVRALTEALEQIKVTSLKASCYPGQFYEIAVEVLK